MMIGMGIAIPLAQPQFSVAALFAAGEQGGWWDPSDFSTMFQDSAGTTPVTATTQPVGMILDKRLGAVRGANIAAASYVTPATFDNVTTSVSATSFTQTAGTTASRSALVIATVVGRWYVVDYTLVSSGGVMQGFARDGATAGGGTILATGASGVTPGQSARLIFQAVSASSNILWVSSAAVSASVTGIAIQDLQGNHRTQSTAASRPTLQQDASGYYYLNYDGVDDFMVTPSVDFTGTQKVTTWAGIYKGSDAALAMLLELSSNSTTNSGTFAILAPTNVAGPDYGFNINGTTAQSNRAATTYASPVSSVLSCQWDVSQATTAAQNVPRINGLTPAGLTSPAASGIAAGFGNYPLYFGRRGGATLPFTGREYGTIIRGAASDANTIARGERFIGSRMGIAL